MSVILTRKRGRPSKAELAAREALKLAAVRTPEQILKEATSRFEVLYKITHAAALGSVRAATVSGAPGVGKTHTVNRVLESHKEQNGLNYVVVKGAISGIQLYMLGYGMKEEKNVIVLDDADGIFQDDDALNILKAMNDSGTERIVSWMKESNALKADGIPTSYIFKGSMIFLTNIDMQRAVDSGTAKIHEHLAAILSRSLYLDLKLHTPAELVEWVCHSVTKHGIMTQLGLNQKQTAEVIRFIRENTEQLRSVSIRTALQVAGLIKADSDTWENDARILLCR